MAQEVFTTTGAGSWTCPIGVKQVLVECWGGGGNGRTSASNPYEGGGGGGAYSASVYNVTPSKSYSYYVASVSEDSYWVNATTVMAKGGATG